MFDHYLCLLDPTDNFGATMTLRPCKKNFLLCHSSHPELVLFNIIVHKQRAKTFLWSVTGRCFSEGCKVILISFCILSLGHRLVLIKNFLNRPSQENVFLSFNHVRGRLAKLQSSYLTNKKPRQNKGHCGKEKQTVFLLSSARVVIFL